MKKLNSVKNHVKKHRAKYAVAGTTTVYLLLINRNNRVFNEFLKEHDLYDEYWTPENSY